MKDEVISSSGDPLLPLRSSSPPPSIAPAASSVGASSPAVPTNVGSIDWFGQVQNSKGGSISRLGSQPKWTSLSTSAGDSALGSSQPSCRPWERADLLRRLSTFNPANWFGKPKAASALACARRGWVNVDVDKIKCESCGVNLKFISSATWTPSEAYSAGEDFTKKLDVGHKVNCPWVGNICAESLVQFPPTPPSALIGGYKDRSDGMLQFPSLPIVAASTIEQMQISRRPEIDRLLSQSQFAGNDLGFKLEIIRTESARDDIFFIYSRAQKLISLCGWEPRWLPNIQDCEENSAQSARNGCSTGPSKYRGHRDPGFGKKKLSAWRKDGYGIDEVMAPMSKAMSRSPLLDCSFCGATVRIWDFLTVVRPASFSHNSSDVPETSKKMALTRGASAASGISGWVAVDGMEKDQVEDHDEAATDEGKSLSNIGVDLNLTISGGLSSSQLQMNVMSEQYQDSPRGRNLLIIQPSSSEIGDRAASHESRGPSSRKRNLDEGGSTVDRPPLLMQQVDSIEGTVIDRDGDEVDDGRQLAAGPAKRVRDSDIVEHHHSSYKNDSSGAGPSHALQMDIGTDAQRDYLSNQGPEQAFGYPWTRDSTHASSIIAMDTVCHSADNDSMESVENHPGDFNDVHFPSTSTFRNTDLNETSELNYSNQAQQSTYPAVKSFGEMGVSSTNDEEVLNADTATGHGRNGPSFGISGGSVGMGASHEAEIHGTDVSIHRADSVVGDGEPIAEITDNQGQIGEFAPDPGLMGDFVPDEMDRVDRADDSQDLMSQSIGRADRGSKVGGYAKEGSVESGEKTSNMRATPLENSLHYSLSCNAILYSGCDASKDEVTQAGKDLTTDDCNSGYLVAKGTGPPNGGSNYEEVVEFDPIKHHNNFCPWVNGNVAAAGCSSSSGSGSCADAPALCGWQLTLDALDAFQSLAQVPIQTMESESAASMHKDDHLTPGRKLLARDSFS